MTKTQTTTYRKTKTGEWVAYGPASVITGPGPVEVAKRDGSRKTETVERVGKPFVADGRQMVYGYLAKSPTGARRPSRNHRRYCEECDEPATPGTNCWETGLAH